MRRFSLAFAVLALGFSLLRHWKMATWQAGKDKNGFLRVGDDVFLSSWA